MLRSRIIPCLLVHQHGLVKTQQFKNPKYVGDPVNAVRIFNEKEVDELVVLDIDATKENREPDFSLIRKLAAECRMPLCYGGGITNAEQACRIIGMGVEKIAISSAAVSDPDLIGRIAVSIGRQSVVVVADTKKNLFGKSSVYTLNGTNNTKLDPVEFAIRSEMLGAGEFLLNSIDRDGMMTGYDLDLATKIRDAINIPMTVLGGAGSVEDIRQLTTKFKVIGAAAGSLFVFKGKYRAVLINYPQGPDKDYAIGR